MYPLWDSLREYNLNSGGTRVMVKIKNCLMNVFDTIAYSNCL